MFEKLSKVVDSYDARRITDSNERYDYLSEETADIVDLINSGDIDLSQYSDADEAREALSDELWTNDSVTGNGSGSYWFSRWKAEEALCHNLELLGEALEEYGSDMDVLKNGAEACDVTIRCYLLGQAIDNALVAVGFEGNGGAEEIADSVESTDSGVQFHVEEGHTLKEWKSKYGSEDLWDFSESDLKDGAVEPDEDRVYWKIGGRYYETTEEV